MAALKESIERLSEIYELLYNGEPSPDEEEDAQKEMIAMFEGLIGDSEASDYKEDFTSILELLKSWDTLDAWFKELPELPDKINQLIEKILPSTESQEEKKEELQKTPTNKEETTKQGKSEIAESATEKKEKITMTSELNQKLANEIAEAVKAATANLPDGIDITAIAKAVTEQVTKAFFKKHNIEEKTSGSQEIETVSKKKVDELAKTEGIKEEIAEKKVEKKEEPPKPEPKKKRKHGRLMAPKIEIPKVSAPMKKVTPSTISAQTQPKPAQARQMQPIQPQAKQAQPKQVQSPVSTPKPVSLKPGLSKEQSSGNISQIRPKKVSKPKVVLGQKKPIPVNINKISVNNMTKKDAPATQSVQQIEKTPVKKTVSLPKPKKITLPTPKKINTTAAPQSKTRLNVSAQVTQKPISVKPVAGAKPISIKPVAGAKPISIKPAAGAKPISVKPVAGAKTISVKPAAGVKPISVKPAAGVKPISVKPIKPKSNDTTSAIPFTNVKPVTVKSNKRTSTVFDAFTASKPAPGMKEKKMGKVKAISIGGGDLEGFGTQKIGGGDDFDTFQPEEPKKVSKDQLYQELIALEGKKYAIERAKKEMKSRYEKGKIPEGEFRALSERFRYDLEHISSKINEIREKIQTL